VASAQLVADRGTTAVLERSGTPRLVVDHVARSYGKTPALVDVSLELWPGEVMALLGPNGAGKTTLLSVVAGLQPPDSGRVRIEGFDVARFPRAARQHLGVAPQELALYPTRSVRDNMLLFGRLSGLTSKELQGAIADVANTLGLDGLLDRRARELSGGQQRRLHTALALLHRPRLLLLDEPTAGADVASRKDILALVNQLADEGSSILYSTHYLEEVERLDARVTFIDHGSVIASGSTRELVSAFGASGVDFSFDGTPPRLEELGGVPVDDHTVRVPTPDPERTIAELVPQLAQRGGLTSVTVLKPGLDTVFFRLTGRQYRSGEEQNDA
jgi:ABC-2 type transport system ATP-binding protein